MSCVTATFREDEPRACSAPVCRGDFNSLPGRPDNRAGATVHTGKTKVHSRCAAGSRQHFGPRESLAKLFKSEVKPSPLSRSRGVHAIFTFPPRAG